jgi:hypothetical protein
LNFMMPNQNQISTQPFAVNSHILQMTFFRKLYSSPVFLCKNKCMNVIFCGRVDYIDN